MPDNAILEAPVPKLSIQKKSLLLNKKMFAAGVAAVVGGVAYVIINKYDSKFFLKTDGQVLETPFTQD